MQGRTRFKHEPSSMLSDSALSYNDDACAPSFKPKFSRDIVEMDSCLICAFVTTSAEKSGVKEMSIFGLNTDYLW